MDFINIIGTFFDNSIEHVVALANQIKDLRLNKNQQDINEDIYNEISLSKQINQQVTNKISFIEEDLETVHSEISEIAENISEINSNLERLQDISSQDIHQINEDINNINDVIENLSNESQDFNQRLSYLEDNGVPDSKNDIKHLIVSQREYDSLESYEKNTLYIIVDFNKNTSVFGDKFPLILGGENTTSHFGDEFPFTLGTDDKESSHFGENFPLILN